MNGMSDILIPHSSATMSKRVNLTTKEKLELISCVENGENKKDVAVKYKIGYSTLCAIIKEKQKLIEAPA